jgi:GTPase SAR1 family protein
MTAQSGYEHIKGVRKELVDLADELGQVVDGIGHKTLGDTVRELRAVVATDTFRVLIAGEFNAGKSTTVNAMLGEKVLPAGGTPTTAVLCVVRWSESSSAVLFRADRRMGDGLDPKPAPIDVTKLEHYVTVGAGRGKPNKWGLAEIYWPLELCRQGIEIIDSPGLNDSADHSKITLDYVNKADAVVFVFSALQALAESERSVVDQQLKVFSHDSMFCLVNRINQVDDDETAKVIKDLRARIHEYWGLGDNRVFFIDAKAALGSRANGKHALAGQSGLLAFETALEQFLATDRGRIKIEPRAAQIQQITAQARGYINDDFIFLDKKVAELTAEWERQRVPLEGLKKDREIINTSIQNHLQGTQSLVSESARKMLQRAASSCAEWAEQIDREHEVTWGRRMRQKVNDAIEEISNGLSDQILRYAEDWQEGELADLIAERAEDLEDQVGEKICAFTGKLDEIRNSLLNVDTPEDEQHLASGLSRTAAGVAGTILSPGLGLVGAQLGFKAMLTALLPQLGVAIVLALVGFTPLALFGALFGMGAIQALLRLNKLNKQIVGSVSASVSSKLRDDATDIAQSIAARIYSELDKERARMDRELADSIVALNEQVQFALNQRDQEEQSSAKKKDQLTASLLKLDEIERRAAKIQNEWAMG